MQDYKNRFKKEAESFNKIAKERSASGRIPDIRKKFFNPYFYNNIWRHSDFVKQHYGASVDWIVAQLRKNKVKSVTELGCGDGWLCLELARAGFQVKGLDISQDSIEIAKNYLTSLPERNNLNLEYICANVLDYQQPLESIICHGFLHHLPPNVLEQFLEQASTRISGEQVLIAVEPRYDKINPLVALLVYVLRRAWPNHFQYEDQNLQDDLQKIMDELSEADKTQSEMDNESGSEQILNFVKKYFNDVQVEYTNAFYDKVIGGIRIAGGDEEKLAVLLKELDNLIVKYSDEISRSLRIIAKNK